MSVLCCIGSVVLFGLDSFTSESDSPASGPTLTASADAADRWVIAYEVGRAKDVTQALPGGAWVALFGTEMNVRDRAAIRSGDMERNNQSEFYEYVFDEDGSYALTHVTRSVMGFIATGVEMDETGGWSLSGTTLTLTPEHQVVNDFIQANNRPRDGDDLQVRRYQIVDVALEPRDHRMVATGPKFLGLSISGPTPFGDDRNPFVLTLQRVR